MFSSQSVQTWEERQASCTLLYTEEDSAQTCDRYIAVTSLNLDFGAVRHSDPFAWICCSAPTEGIKGIDNRMELQQPSLNVNIWYPSCCHSPQLNVFTSWLSRAGLLWQVGAVGWLEDEKGYISHWNWSPTHSFSNRWEEKMVLLPSHGLIKEVLQGGDLL